MQARLDQSVADRLLDAKDLGDADLGHLGLDGPADGLGALARGLREAGLRGVKSPLAPSQLILGHTPINRGVYLHPYFPVSGTTWV
jgi:hypothetical protein